VVILGDSHLLQTYSIDLYMGPLNFLSYSFLTFPQCATIYYVNCLSKCIIPCLKTLLVEFVACINEETPILGVCQSGIINLARWLRFEAARVLNLDRDF
jgi:hypothetical protein